MIVFALFLGLFGLTLSSIFSGSETGFYRISRVRLKLDAMGNDRTARKLLALVNRPSLFVSTVLVGNNVANYMISMATVLFVGAVLPKNQGIAVEIGSTLAVAPFLFVYGEMFPKFIGMRAPSRLLRFFSPILFFFFWLFIPFSSLIWLVNQGIAFLLGQSHEMLRLTLGRKELNWVLDEGKENGILFETQRRLADGVFEISHRDVRDWAISPPCWPRITTDMSPTLVLEIARKHQILELPVYDISYDSEPFDREWTPENQTEIPIGFVRVIDLELAVRNRLPEKSKDLLRLLQTEIPVRDLVEISSRHSLLTAMILLQTMHGSFGCVIDPDRRCVGFIRSDQLRDVLLGESKK